MARLARRRRSLGAAGSSGTRWLIGAGVAALAVAGFWYFRSRASASMDAPSWTPGPLTPMSPDQARQFYKIGLLQHALGVATLKLALLREQNLQNPVPPDAPEAAARAVFDAVISAENMVREISASLARVRNGQSLSLAETNDLITYLAANPA